jgi:hypothetical protein
VFTPGFFLREHAVGIQGSIPGGVTLEARCLRRAFFCVSTPSVFKVQFPVVTRSPVFTPGFFFA